MKKELTKEEAFDYAKEHGFQNLPCRIIDKLNIMPGMLFEYARRLEYKNVPKVIIDILANTLLQLPVMPKL